MLRLAVPDGDDMTKESILANLERIANKDIDRLLAQIREDGKPLDAAFFDKISRPICVAVAIHRFTDTDPRSFQDSLTWAVACGLSEFVMNMTKDPNEMAALATQVLAEIATSMQFQLNSNVGPNLKFN